MFERFRDGARRVVQVLAPEEARLLNHNFIGTEHILLGLVREGEGVAAKALEALGVSLEAVREKVRETIGPAGNAPAGSPPFTPRAKKVLEASLREALQLGHNYIDTEHLLLGLVREGEGVAGQVLVSLGADLSRVRQQVIQLLVGYEGLQPPPGPGLRGGIGPLTPEAPGPIVREREVLGGPNPTPPGESFWRVNVFLRGVGRPLILASRTEPSLRFADGDGRRLATVEADWTTAEMGITPPAYLDWSAVVAVTWLPPRPPRSHGRLPPEPARPEPPSGEATTVGPETQPVLASVTLAELADEIVRHRSAQVEHYPLTPAPQAVSVGDITLDLVANKVFDGDQEVDLSRREFELLRLLMLNGDQIRALGQLAEKARARLADKEQRGGAEASENPPNQSSSSSWIGQGPRLEQARERHRANALPGRPAGPGFPPTLTSPIDVTGNGSYTVTGGPVPLSADTQINPGVAFPRDIKEYFRFNFRQGGMPHLITVDGETYVQATFDVTDFKAPYSGLRVWIT